jgi:hypothetical protein
MNGMRDGEEKPALNQQPDSQGEVNPRFLRGCYALS